MVGDKVVAGAMANKLSIVREGGDLVIYWGEYEGARLSIEELLADE